MSVRTVLERLSKPSRTTAIVIVSALAIGGASVGIAAAAVDAHERQVEREASAREAAAAARLAAAAAEELAEARDAAAAVNADFAGFIASVAGVVPAETAAAFEAARIRLALAISDGDVVEIERSGASVADALDALLESAGPQADQLLGASPLADQASKDALAAASSGLRRAPDARAALLLLKTATDAVVAAQAAGQAAADAAAAAAEEAARQAAERRGGGGSGGGGGTSDGDSGGSGSGPGIIGMFPGNSVSCSTRPGGVVDLDFGWKAREGNTVDVSYAYTDGDYPATGGFVQVGWDLGASGSITIPRPCPVEPGPSPRITVMLVAKYGGTSAMPATYWGL